MNFKDRLLKKSNLWHVGAVLLFVIIACVYFAPALKGYSLKQADVVNFSGMSREVLDYRDNSGEQILWTNSMFSGMPSTQISMKYEGTWLATAITKIVRFGLPAPIFFLFVYFISFYVLALSLRIKPLISIIGALAFGFSSYFIVILEAGHNSKAAAIGLAPLMIAGFIMAYRFKNWFLGVALSSVFMMIQLAANHVQITYYMAFILLLLGAVEAYRYVKEGQVLKFLNITGLLVVGYGLAVMVNYGNLFGTIEYSSQTIRGGSELTINPDGSSTEAIKTEGLDRDYVTNWSYGHGETFTFMVPNFKGGESRYMGQNEDNKDILKNIDAGFRTEVSNSNQYWGDQPGTSGPVYIGIIIMFLACLGLVYVKDKYKWALLSVTLLTIMLSWGKNYVSVLVVLPILLYNVNIFLDNKKQLIFSGANTLLLFFAMAKGELIFATSLTDFFLDYVPGYNKLRAVTIILVVAELCIPLLAILFLQRLYKAKEEIKKNSLGLYVVSAIFSLFLFILLISPETFNSFLGAPEMAQLDQIAGISDARTQTYYFSLFDAIQEARMEIFKSDVLRSIGFFGVGLGLVLAFLRTNISKYALGAGLVVFVVMDLMLVDMRYLNNDGRGKTYNQWVETYEMKYPFAAGAGEDKILEMELRENPGIQIKIDSALLALNEEFKGDKEISNREKELRRDFVTFRVLNRNTNFRVYEEGNPYNSSYTSYFNKSIGGYHGAKLGRYQDLITFHISKGNPSVVNMLNTKYYLRPEPGANGRIGNTKLSQVNADALGNAWFSKEIKTVQTADEEILALEAFNATTLKNKGLGQVFVNGESVQITELRGAEAIAVLLPGMAEPFPIEGIPYGALRAEPLALIADSTGFNWVYDSAPDSVFDKVFSIGSNGVGGWDPTKTTIVDQRFAENVHSASYSGNGTIEMTSYHPDRMMYKSSSSETQFAVFSEVYYEGGWKAFVDNQEVPVSRVNYLLRGIEVPAGDHEIKFEFKLQTFDDAKIVAWVGTFAILILLIIGLYFETKRIEESPVIDTEKSNESSVEIE